MKKLSEIAELTDFFFRERIEYDKKLLSWQETSEKETKEALFTLEGVLSKIQEKDWEREKLEKVLLKETEKLGDRGKLLWPLRAALSGKEASAGPFEIAELLGRAKTLKRIKQAQALL